MTLGRWAVAVASCFHLAQVVSPATLAAEEWFPRFDFHLGSRYVTSADPRFNWMFDFGGDLDVLGGDRGRATLIANYEAIAGEQYRRFDVNQGNYLLEGALLFRVAAIEVGPVWHHVSRHLSDRAKRIPIDWNMIALRARSDHRTARVDVAWSADARAAVMTASVDYDWEAEAGGAVAWRLTPRFGLTAGSVVRVVGVDGTQPRGAQVEARVETGVRIEGRGAAAELFIGAERRVDPYPVEFGTASWFMAGFRLKSR